jgi:hypothetical protein
VLNVADFLVQGMYLKSDWEAAMAAINKPAMANSTVALYVVLDFVVGILGLWLYAAIRPRFGPGPRTAVIAGLVLWLTLGFLGTAFMYPMHIVTDKMIAVSLIQMLIACPLAVAAGARMYSEESADVMAHA